MWAPVDTPSPKPHQKFGWRARVSCVNSVIHLQRISRFLTVCKILDILVYKIPYRRARAWPSARASKGICIQARYLCSRAHSAARPSARATIGYLVYKIFGLGLQKYLAAKF